MKTKFRLYKRADDGTEMDPTAAGYRERPYYFRFAYRKERYTRCLETPDAIEAQKRARAKYLEITQAVSAGAYKQLAASKLRQEQTATIEDLIRAYRTGPAQADGDTRDTNINSLRLILGSATHVRDLTPALAHAAFNAVTAKILEMEQDETLDGAAVQEQAASLRRSANSRWAKIRSIFTPRCLEYYRLQGIYHDNMQAFLNAGNLAMFTRIPKVSYNPPPERVIAQTLADWEALTDRDLFLAIGHELAFGQRISEFAQAKWSWHTERNGYPVLDGRAKVKNGSAIIQVRALDPFYSIMMRIARQNDWVPAAGSPQYEAAMIEGSNAYRADGLFRAVSDWMRTRGWKTRKTNHALRAYAGCQIAMRYGIYEAQMWLRHSTVKVTEQNYSHFVAKFKPSDLDQIAARWATSQPIAAKVASAKSEATLDATVELRRTPPDSAESLVWLASRN